MFKNTFVITGANYHLPVVMISHGYGVKNTEYSFIANSLAEQGYHVISIQHDLMMILICQELETYIG